MKISLPELSLVVLIGASGSGKSTFARKHFKPTEVISSDHCRSLVSDDENNLEATNDAFELLHFIAAKRLAAGRLTVIDATNVQPEARKPLIALAREYHVFAIAIVLNTPEMVCRERNEQRPDRDFGPHVIRRQQQSLRRSIPGLEREGFRNIYILRGPDEIEAAAIERQKLWNDRRNEHGPFDIIGDVHGCYDELRRLLEQLGYQSKTCSPSDPAAGWNVFYEHPQGRKAVFLGDLVDRGPRILDSLALVKNMVLAGTALCVPGNHDIKFARLLRGRNVKLTHGLDRSKAEVDALAEAARGQVASDFADFIESLVSHLMLDDGKLVVAHAGLKEKLQGRSSGKVRDFALFGETTGETDEFGLPVRYNWAAEYRGKSMVVYGHTPVPEAEWLNNTICLDTGCVFGGKLTALRYPERELVSVPAPKVYYEAVKSFLPAPAGAQVLSAQQEHDDILDLADVLGKRIVDTRLNGKVTIREENAIAALEVMSRFAVDPRWLIYLPPTMSPPATTQEAGLLEHPSEAFSYFANEDVARVVCEEKHMGSRAVAIVCRDEDAARRRFGIVGDGGGVIYTRTGRRFFNDRELEKGFLERLHAALGASRLWDEFATDWFCLDCELMPWSAKAQELLRRQYAAVGAAAHASLPEAVAALRMAAGRDGDAMGLLERQQRRAEMTERYRESYRRYCWPVNSLTDLKLAPFHLLASEGQVHVMREHVWHMETLARFCREDEDLLLATDYKVIELADEHSRRAGIEWWEALTARGGEGMVVKPGEFIATGRRGLIQPAVKCRGREYLRIIYGPEYTSEENLNRLRERGLSHKRSLALREFALGIEALERFVRREPLRRIHECVFGVLALESEPIDPRL
ncbi:MAG: polynucleotide kinase-phosphatase [Blastocatellia bacterium]|nr:polynucleotide kinase-phosphatase [Blastocatellia bacterium]